MKFSTAILFTILSATTDFSYNYESKVSNRIAVFAQEDAAIVTDGEEPLGDDDDEDDETTPLVPAGKNITEPPVPNIGRPTLVPTSIVTDVTPFPTVEVVTTVTPVSRWESHTHKGVKTHTHKSQMRMKMLLLLAMTS